MLLFFNTKLFKKISIICNVLGMEHLSNFMEKKSGINIPYLKKEQPYIVGTHLSFDNETIPMSTSDNASRIKNEKSLLPRALEHFHVINLRLSLILTNKTEPPLL